MEYGETVNNKAAQPQAYGLTPIQPYFAARGARVIKLKVKTTSKTNFFLYKRIVQGLIDSDEVLYFKDSVFKLVDASYGFWGIVTAFESSLSARDVGTFNFEIVVTTDHADSGYNP